MRNVLPGSLWIGNAHDARDISTVLSSGIEAIVDLAPEEPPVQITRELVYLRIPICDGDNSSELITTAINAIHTLVSQKIPTLVTYGAGMSRSPAIVAAALVRDAADSFEDILAEITAGHPHDVSTVLLESVKKCLNT